MNLQGRLRGAPLIAVLGRDVTVRLLQISRSGCLLESADVLPIGVVAALSVEIEGRRYSDEVRVLRSQRVAGGGERHMVGVEFLWLRLPGKESLRSYAAALSTSSTHPRIDEGL
jgi:hypothetical protein